MSTYFKSLKYCFVKISFVALLYIFKYRLHVYLVKRYNEGKHPHLTDVLLYYHYLHFFFAFLLSSPVLDGHKIPHLAKTKAYAPRAEDEDKSTKNADEDNYVLQKLFKKSGMYHLTAHCPDYL